ncbi:exodeoxyribonuclease V subunit gamma [Halochromatium salexigens]|uniref:RecBCD enzyme subunit RecC n=1 Tax=Halochromatium salexigens TaxID=49447 RepID=A0AAJ0UHE5_HALSE|nr:exodeoxyribonuclease V subunit gamma [Halochromatium salexigens]MBK5931540.1 exodeoxyribonuclease V subunit gamma [Halochromatium salexigens]
MEQKTDHTNDWPTGFMLIQANRLESLRGLLSTWLRRHPLHPLENEAILVQSNGIGQWLKLALAALPADDPMARAGVASGAGASGTLSSDATEGGCGIAAALDMMLPGRFLWQAYRAVLGDLPDVSAYDKVPLGWRLYRLLGALEDLADHGAEQGWLAPLRGFLDADPHHDGRARRRHQLAERLADLYDQYQVYRADWLAAWQQGEDVLIRPNGERVALPEDQRWQSLLWRRLKQDLSGTGMGAGTDTEKATLASGGLEASRAEIHTRFLTQAKALTPETRPEDLPRRVIVFGISSLPRQTIEVLEAIAPVAQVMLLVNNPSRHYWGDIVEGRELFRRTYQRSAERKVPDGLDEQTLHLHGHPLLAAWGKQGRDYIRLLDEHDDRTQYEQHFAAQRLKIDLFESPIDPDTAGTASLLQQLQDDILELRTLQERRALNTAIDPRRDHSLVFQVAHSPQREIEILQDQLLAAFAAAKTGDEASATTPLSPRDILIMVPDIATYAPHIEAVFGRLARDDPRFIPFHIADQGERQRNPLLIGLETLLNLPQARLSTSDVLDLLDIPALRARFGLQESDLPRLRQWVAGAQIRWGLDAAQRAGLGLPAGLEQNSWRFGLERMLLGFATGDSDPWHEVEPYAEVGGLESALVGRLDALLQTLVHYWTQLQQPRSAKAWAVLIASLLEDCFSAESETEELTLAGLREALEQWQQEGARGGLGDEPLPLEVVRRSLLTRLDEPTLSQRFLDGSVNFATLMPMRAIPFRQIWLLGMNDGDYPRSRRPVDFDLMAHDYRPGDRSRREDDRYLFLEALLSAREQLVISWVGRSLRDNSPRPPSVLVGQLRDHLAAGWPLAAAANASVAADALVTALTTEHPLQPFSRRYFEPGRDPRLFTYAHEWRALHRAAPSPGAVSDSRPTTETTSAPASRPAPKREQPPSLPPPSIDGPIQLATLGHFLRHPVRTFYTQRLQASLEREVEQSEDVEPFAIDALSGWRLRQQVIDAVALQWVQTPERTLDEGLERAIGRLARTGQLPLKPFDAPWVEQLTAALTAPLARYQALLAAHPQSLPNQVVHLEQAGLVLEDRLTGLRAAADGERLRLTLQASELVKDQRLKWYHLVRRWPAHLAAQCEAPTTSWLIGPGSAVILAPLAPDEAQAHLRALLQGYVEGLTQLLPLACRTAFAALAKEAGDRRANPAETYEGGFNRSGECDDHPGYRRYWPDYGALSADPGAGLGAGSNRGFHSLVEQVYAPLFAHTPTLEDL